MPISVVIADDHSLVRDAFRSLLDRHGDIAIVGEAANGSDALTVIDATHPDVILMDLSMPRMSGLEAIQQLSDRHTAYRVLALSSHTSQKWVIRALRVGVRGYVLKTETSENLDTAVRAVHRGGTWFSHEVSTVIARLALDPQSSLIDPLERLSHRQRVVLQLIAEGQSNKQIAHTLAISESTVDSHRTQLMRRLDLHDVASLVRFACQEGLVALE